MSQTTRRNGNSSSPQRKPSGDASRPPSPDRSQRTSASRPSPYVLLIYPVILALGSLFSLLSPSAYVSTSPAPLMPGVASDLNTPRTPQALNYFAGKQNIFNVYFVKMGWFWTTLAFILLQLTTSQGQQQPKQRISTSNSTAQTRHHIQSLLRYTLITVSWFLTTQWFFGPALIDRSFTSTGGRCLASPLSPASPTTIDISTVTTGLGCKTAGGTWHGGHDISGHFFMLVLSSAFLHLESHIAKSHSQSTSQLPHISGPAAAAIARHATEDEKRAVGGWESDAVATTTGLYTHRFVWIVVGLDVWMLFMTAIWFHTLFEKVSGMVLAAVCVWTVYFLPRLVPGWGEVVGGV